VSGFQIRPYATRPWTYWSPAHPHFSARIVCARTFSEAWPSGVSDCPHPKLARRRKDALHIRQPRWKFGSSRPRVVTGTRLVRTGRRLASRSLRRNGKLVCGKWHQQVAGIRLVAQPARKPIVRQYREHAIMDLRDQFVGRDGDDGERPLPFACQRIAPIFSYPATPNGWPSRREIA
jgi:hypothetical protein